MDADTTVVPGISPDLVITGLIIVLCLVLAYLIIREIRLLKTTNRSNELDIERQKIKLLQQYEASKTVPFTRFSPDQVTQIKQIEDDNTTIAIDNYAKEVILDKRLTRLENMAKSKKLDHLLESTLHQEKKVK